MAQRLHWYSVSFLGGLMTGIYALVPPYIIYIDRLGFLSSFTRLTVGTCMVVLVGILLFCRRTKQKPFHRAAAQKHSARSGFTLVEILIVISILGIIAALILPFFMRGRGQGYESRAKVELRTIAEGTKFLSVELDGYPADVDRNLPNGLEAYLAPGNWPEAPWPGSVYDWDNWAPSALSYPPFERVLQISVRFCPYGQPQSCDFPNEEWAENFDYYSAYYYCIEGPCRSHSSKPVTHPGYCVNCDS